MWEVIKKHSTAINEPEGMCHKYVKWLDYIYRPGGSAKRVPKVHHWKSSGIGKQ